MNSQNNRQSRRLDGYIRVSEVRGREGDSFISPDVQEERIRAWAVANGHEIIAVHHELDVSGGTMDRPMLNEVIARIDSGETDGVVVFNISRFARTLIGSIELVHRINEKGALFASVSDGLDITTVTGRMVLGILLSIAQAERERLGESWREAKSKAVGRGIHVSANVPFGYIRPRTEANPRTGKRATLPLEPDPETAWMIPELFRMRAAGESWSALRIWLVDHDAQTVRGAEWAASTLMGLIQNRVYLGEARGAGAALAVPGAHKPLVDEATWQAAQGRRGPRFEGKDNGAVLRGLIRCGGCRYVMQTRAPTARGGKVEYVCNSRVGCPRPAMALGRDDINGVLGLDDVVVEIVREWESERAERIKYEGFDPALDIEGLEQELAALVAARERDRLDDELREALGRREWLKHLADLSERVKGKQAEVEEKLRQLGTPAGRPTAELWKKWDSGEMTVAEKRAHLAGVLQAVFVNPEGARAVARKNPELRRRGLRARVHPVWVIDPPLTEIPRQGLGGYRITAWPFPDPDPDVLGVVALQPEVEDAGETVG